MSSIAFALVLIARHPPDDLLAPGAKLEKLWDKGAFTEGGAWPATARSCSPTSATGS